MARAIKHIKAGLLHVEVIGTIPEREPGRRRGGRCRPTCPAQQFYNDKCSWRECELQLAANFSGRDLVLTLTYGDARLPADKRAADKEFQKFIRKLRTARRRRGEELRYIYVTEGWHGREARSRREQRGWNGARPSSGPHGGPEPRPSRSEAARREQAERDNIGGYFDDDGPLEDRRLHHHVVLNGVGPGDLEEFRSLWEPIGGGYVRAEPVDVHYYRELAKYLTKETREFGRAKPGERSWRASRNLKKYEVEYEEIRSDSVTLTAPPGAVDYVQFSERNPYGFADCVWARYLLFEEAPPPEYSYTLGRKRKTEHF